VKWAVCLSAGNVHVTSQCQAGLGLGGNVQVRAGDKVGAQLAVTDAAPEACRLYERHGFRVWGVEPRALCWDGRAVDETYMILDRRDGHSV
jgi:hypothetical protein